MATTWAVKQEAIRLAVATAIGVPDRLGADDLTSIKEVEWENHRDATARWGNDERPLVNLRLGSIRSVGDDERRDVYDEDADRIHTYYCGNRHFTITVTIMIPNQLPGMESVGELGSRLRTRLRADRIHKIYADADCAVVRVLETRVVDELEINGRMMSASVTDIRMATVEEWEDNDTDSGDFIESVEADGELRHTVDSVEFIPAHIDTLLEG